MGVPLQCSILLVNQRGFLHECNSSSANYLFQQDKFYDTSYDTGDKSLSCGRKVDAFKFWLMWKKWGSLGFERLIENAFDKAAFLADEIKRRDGFELLMPRFEYTNVWENVSAITALIKERMMLNGNMMIGYSPLHHKGVGNFIRMVITCHPPATEDSMRFVLDQIEEIGESFEYHNQF
jgi:sulfinoalanine decarboxylase / aspartate 1-decarboxylase